MSLEIVLSSDLLTATVLLPYDSKGYFVPVTVLRKEMEAKGIVFGINEDAIMKIYADYGEVREKIINKFALNKDQHVEFLNLDQKDLTHKVVKAIKHEFKEIKTVVASGLAHIRGQDAQVDFSEDSSEIGILREDGSLDYRGRNPLIPVAANSVLAWHLFAEPGVEGQNILGQVIPAEPGDETSVILGENVVFEEDTGKYTCVVDGLMTFEEGVLTVDDTITVDEVNMETGNLDVEGNVVVKNNIEAGATVKVLGNLLVEGNIEKAHVSVTGNIVIRKGVAFSRDSSDSSYAIEATGDIEMSHATNAVIRAGGTVFVHTVAQHCDMDACHAIVMTTKKGQLMGGEATALNYIQVNEMGGSANPQTKVGVGLRHCKQVSAIVNQLEKFEQTITSINEVIGEKAGIKTKLAVVDMLLWQSLQDFRFDLAKRSYVLRNKIEDLLISYNQEMSRAIVIKEAHSKVELSIDSQKKKFHDSERGRKYWCGSRKIEWSPVRECIKEKIINFEFELDIELLASYSVDGFISINEGDLRKWGEEEEKELSKLIAKAVKLVGNNSSAHVNINERIGNIILIVEDQSIIRRVMRMKLEHHGFEVYEAEEGGEAFKILMNQKIDLAIVDLVMPGVSGLQLCHMIRKIEKLKNLPIIVCTALNTPNDIKEAIQAGASNYIVKPYDDNDLLEKIDKYLAPDPTEGES